MFAVVETGGKQYQIQEGRYIDVDLMNAEPESKVTLETIVAIIADEKTQVGAPFIEGGKVEGTIVKHFKGKKEIVYKMRRKKGYRLKAGHRQQYTRLLVENIEFPNKEETMAYAKSLEEKEEAAQKEQEAKLAKAKEKKQAKKAEKKAASKKVTTKEKVEAKPPAEEEAPKASEEQASAEVATEEQAPQAAEQAEVTSEDKE